MDAVRAFAAAVKRTKGLRTEYTPEQILANRHLGRLREGLLIPNIACALLFAKDPLQAVPGCVIRFQRYEGTAKLTGDKRNVVKDVFIEGRVPDIIVEANQVVQSQIRTFSRLGRDGKFFTAPEYPQPAWYEAIVNACVHRSYHLKNMMIFVKMFDDRLEIESPGGFPPHVTPANIYEVHHRRNFFLMDAMYYMDFVKCENEGTRRMREVMLAMDLPEPEFQQKQVGDIVVRVTLRNNKEHRKVWIDGDASTVINEALFKTLTDDQKRCINFVVEHGQISVSEAMRLTQLTWPAAKKMLMGIVEKDIFDRVSKFHRDPNAFFRLKASPTQNNDFPR